MDFPWQILPIKHTLRLHLIASKENGWKENIFQGNDLPRKYFPGNCLEPNDFMMDSMCKFEVGCNVKRVRRMGDADSTSGNLDIDLESGGAKSEENGSKSQGLGGGSSKKLLSRVRSGFLRGESPDGYKRVRDRSRSYDKLLDLDEISLMNMEIKFGKARDETINSLDKEKSKKAELCKAFKATPASQTSLIGCCRCEDAQGNLNAQLETQTTGENQDLKDNKKGEGIIIEC
ncbi:Uncharacterized protein Adt_25784 [Abeliophyllum distichum]|uniref:Uncharacterized protein n=1 Tax=Abeliophyllum distichum TaxID=126358 RepID=A0ABD1RPS1_9LAMI